MAQIIILIYIKYYYDNNKNTYLSIYKTKLKAKDSFNHSKRVKYIKSNRIKLFFIIENYIKNSLI